MTVEFFSSTVARATNRELPIYDLLSAAGQLDAAGEKGQVIELYRIWLEHNPDAPLRHAVYFNYGIVLSDAGDLEAAKAALSEAIRLNPDFHPPYINLGLLLSRMGANGDAIAQWSQLATKLNQITADAIGYKATALKNIGRIFEENRLDQKAEETLRQSLELNPQQLDVVEHMIILRQKQCKWPVIEPFAAITREHLLRNISALSLSVYADDPLWQLANAYRHSKMTAESGGKKTFLDRHLPARYSQKSGRLKVGYLSSDLREHAIGFLTAEIYELHDRAKIEIFVYYTGIPSNDAINTRIKNAVEHWTDISKMPDDLAAQKIVDDGIDILVDLNGDTLGSRGGVLSQRPAPVIVNWLGFPGTTGSAHHHYVIADNFIIPPESEIFYTEKVARLPCYQPNDRKRTVSDKEITRQQVGLPEDAVVYCSFNGTHKITPHTWRRWMAILQQVPDSVLWLLESSETMFGKMRELAAAHGVAPERLIFAPRMHVAEHLKRYPLADLFLDTTPYGAHTTSSDALWMGVPVITLSGRSFASRVCGSLVTSAGLGELVCTTSERFVSLAVELGKDRARLRQLRERLKANRDSCVLFDTPGLVAHLETLYAGMWQDFMAGQLPRPDRSNLEIYNEIAIEIDRDDIELLGVGNYLDLYREKLRARDRLSLIRPDGRLWTGA